MSLDGVISNTIPKKEHFLEQKLFLETIFVESVGSEEFLLVWTFLKFANKNRINKERRGEIVQINKVLEQMDWWPFYFCEELSSPTTSLLLCIHLASSSWMTFSTTLRRVFWNKEESALPSRKSTKALASWGSFFMEARRRAAILSCPKAGTCSLKKFWKSSPLFFFAFDAIVVTTRDMPKRSSSLTATCSGSDDKSTSATPFNYGACTKPARLASWAETAHVHRREQKRQPTILRKSLTSPNFIKWS